MNFFKWAIENKVIDYINNNYKEIDADMNLRNSLGNKKRIDSESLDKKKRTELSLSAVKTIKKEEVEIQIVFH